MQKATGYHPGRKYDDEAGCTGISNQYLIYLLTVDRYFELLYKTSSGTVTSLSVTSYDVEVVKVFLPSYFR